MLGRVQIQGHHILQLVLEVRILAEREGSDPVGFQAMGGPDPLHERRIRPQAPSQGARSPIDKTRLLIMLGLGEKKRGVEPLLLHQLVMGSPFHNLAVIDDKNPIGHFDSRQSMADQNRHTPLGEFVKPFEQFRFCLGIHCAGRLIKNQNLRVAKDGPGERHFLPFTDAQFMPAIEQLAEQ